MVELKGTLDGVGLPAIVHLLGELRETGLLRLTSGTWLGELAFEHGQLIAATFGQDRGLDALAACTLTVANGEFTFVEQANSVEPNITLSSDELRQRLDELSGGQSPSMPALDSVPRLVVDAPPTTEQLVLDRTAVQMLLLVDGTRTVRDIVADRPLVPTLRNLALLAQQGLIAFQPAPGSTTTRLSPRPRAAPAPAAVPQAPPTVEDGILGVCPSLGFADDQARHYSRPTALHRCYATQLPSVISSQDQRDLCLGGRYPTCPRFRLAGSPPSADEPRLPAPVPDVPPGVAARLSIAKHMSVASGTGQHEVPTWLGQEDQPARSAASSSTRPAAGAGQRWPARSRLPRGAVLIAGGAVIGLVAVVGGLMALPLLQPPLVQTQPTAVPAFAAIATSSPVRTTPPVTAATSAPKPTAAPTTAPRLPTATTPQVGDNVLLDARFASGAQKDWLENPPFAGWRDGAYRLVARQATRFVAVAAPVRVPDDVVISATLRKTGGSPGGGYGLIVRNQTAEALNGTNQSFDAYVLETGDLGEFGVWRRDNDRWVDLVPWTRSQAVRQGGSPNELIVRLSGSQLLLTINGIEVARVDDDVLAHGGVGVFAGGDLNEVALDRFTVQVPN